MVAPEERADLERLAQYIIRNPFSVEKMQVNQGRRLDLSLLLTTGR